MEPGPRPTNAEMAQPVAMLEDAGYVEMFAVAVLVIMWPFNPDRSPL